MEGHSGILFYYQSQSCVWNSYIWNHSHVFQGTMSCNFNYTQRTLLFILQLQEVSKLHSLKNLTQMTIAENPVSRLPHCRSYLVFHLRTLEGLDGQGITLQERHVAQTRFAQGMWCDGCHGNQWGPEETYCQTSNISCTLVAHLVDHSDVVEASPIGAAPTNGTSSFFI